ncbi:MAG: hypothetical protein ACOYXS_02165 [Chloroflexota bacterium]
MIERPGSSPATNPTGLVATAFAAALVVMLMLIVAANQDGLSPPSTIPVWLPLGLAYGAPAVVGWLGVLGDHRPLLVAAGLLYLPLAVLAFSGVTLPFLLPALLFLRAATNARPVPEPGDQLESGPAPAKRPRRLLMVLAAGLLSAPIVVWLVLNLMLAAVVGLILAAGLAQLARGARTSHQPRSAEPPPTRTAARLPGALAAIAIVALVLVGLGAALSTTEERCWIRTDTPTGPVFRQVPPTDVMTLSPGESGGGCNSGEYTVVGLGLEAGLIAVAIALATLVARRPAPARS